MKILTFTEHKYEAERIVKTGDSITGYNGGKEIFAFRGISDFSMFVINGEWDDPEPTQFESLQTENTALKLAITELAEVQEIDKTQMQLALAEIAAFIKRGEMDG